jgi:hypothetical protein
MSVTEALRAVCRAGKATLTTVQAMLEARIVAIRTHGPLYCRTALGEVCIADSSHGDFIGITRLTSGRPLRTAPFDAVLAGGWFRKKEFRVCGRQTAPYQIGELAAALFGPEVVAMVC